MRKLMLILLFMLCLVGSTFAADTWTFQIKQVALNGNRITIVVMIRLNGQDYAGRELTYEKSDWDSKTVEQIKGIVIEAVKNTIQEEFTPEIQFRNKLATVVNTEVTIK